MPDAYADLRAVPLLDVLLALGWDASAFKVRKQGTEFSGKCPICQPKRNATAFNFSVDGRFHCFSCDAKGRGAIDLYKAIKQCGFQEAVDALKDLKPIVPRQTPAPPAPRIEQQLPMENPPFKATYDKYAVPSDWLTARGFTADTLKHYEVYQYHNPARRSAYSGSVMLKIRRYSDGECVGYLVRNIGEITPEKPKYLFPKGIAKALEVFGAWQLKNEPERLATVSGSARRYIYLLESPFAVMKFHQLGLPAVSCFGWSVSPPQLEILASLAKGIVYLPDRDKITEAVHVAGQLSQRLWVKMPALPDGVDDPEQLGAEQVRALS